MINTLSGIMFGIGFSLVVLFFYALSKHRNRLSGIFSIICLTVAIYVIGYGLELRSDSVEEIKFFLKMEYFGQPFMFAFWLLFTYKFYFKREPSLRLSILLFIIPVLTLFFSVTNEYHHLFYADVSVVQYNGFIIAELRKGPWYYVHVIFSYIALLAGLIYFYKAWRNSLYKRRIQSLLLFFGALFPGIIELCYFIGLSPLGLDLTPFGMSVLAICYYIALFRYDFLELDETMQNVIFSEISEGIMVLDYKNRLINFNNAACKVFDWLNCENIGMDLIQFEKAKEMIEHRKNVFEIEVLQNNTQRYYEFHVTELKEKNDFLGSVYFMRDITQQKKMICELDNLASYDYLTQVYNRRRFLEEAEKEALRVKRYKDCLSFLMIDIDYFKEINDKYGHLAGDEVIKSIVTACKERIRRTDIIGRYGGEEFAVLLPLSNIEDAQNVAEQIREKIEVIEILYLEKKIKVTVSIGVATASSNSSEEIDLYQLINKADMALYYAKNKGRNRVFQWS